MLTECPNCQTRYDIDPALLRRRSRRILCAACGERWFMSALAPEPTPPASASLPSLWIEPPRTTAAAPGRSRAAAAHVAPKSRRPASSGFPLAALRGACALGCLAAAMGLVWKRESVVRQMPGAERLYAAIGLPVNLRGLEFRQVKSSMLREGDGKTLAVEGVIAQVGRQPEPIPDLRVVVRDATGREIYTWTAPSPQPRLGRGETVPFRARLASPPPDAAEVKVAFVDAAAR